MSGIDEMERCSLCGVSAWVGPTARKPDGELVCDQCLAEEEESDRFVWEEGDVTITEGPLYPEVVVELIGQDGNAFAILGNVQRAMRRAGVPREEIAEFMEEATAADYQQLLRVVMRWVVVE